MVNFKFDGRPCRERGFEHPGNAREIFHRRKIQTRQLVQRAVNADIECACVDRLKSEGCRTDCAAMQITCGCRGLRRDKSGLYRLSNH